MRSSKRTAVRQSVGGSSGSRLTRDRRLRRYGLEALEPRLACSELNGLSSASPFEATGNQYAGNEDAAIVGNVIADDTGAGADRSGQPGVPLVVTQVNGQPLPAAGAITLPSGASLTMQPEGSFVFDPSTSRTLSAVPTHGTRTDSFTYGVQQGYTSLIVFGDSLSDVGNLYQLTGQQFPPTPYAAGRASNGPVWIEYVAAHLDLASTPAYAAVNPGTNYAVFGATTGSGNTADTRPELGGNNDFPGLQDEIRRYLAGLGTQPADPNALYVVWAGPNDVFQTYDMGADLAAAATQAVGNIAGAVQTLIEHGARHFLVPNMVDLGQTPFGLATGAGAQLRMLVAGFNAGLQQAVAGIEAAAPGVELLQVDVFAAFDDLLAHASDSGFQDTTHCFVDTLAGDPNQYVFWDAVHPTTRAHAELAERIWDEIRFHSSIAQVRTATVTLRIDDRTTPPVAQVTGPALAVPGQTLTFVVSATDASPADQAASVTYTIDWNGDGRQTERVTGSAVGMQVVHTFSATGTRNVKVTATDQDGDTSPAASVSVDVRQIALIGGDLYVGGTGKRDLIAFSAYRRGQVGVLVNGRKVGVYNLAPTATLFAYGLGGDDWISASGLPYAVVFDGGEGNDHLIGGNRDDRLIGGSGRDRLFGMLGADELLGGAGQDWLFGHQGDDRLFGEAGDDWLFAGGGNDELDGGDGFDRLFGGPGCKTCRGGERMYGRGR